MAVYLGMAAFLCAGSLLWSSQVEHLTPKKRKMLQDLFLLAAGALFVRSYFRKCYIQRRIFPRHIETIGNNFLINNHFG